MARNPHRYDTNDDGDAAAGTARSWAGRAGHTMQQELSSSGGPRGCRRQWLHGQWWQQQRDYRSDGGSMYVTAQPGRGPEDDDYDPQRENEVRAAMAVLERLLGAWEYETDHVQTARAVSSYTPHPSTHYQEPWE
ncbi:hypothetical protein EDB83DRAFT_2535275 [Lactarius deliciosus]|nr:hypothetical protein EDB83DRAFT_2535275 [Lactarius deliciosus]